MFDPVAKKLPAKANQIISAALNAVDSEKAVKDNVIYKNNHLVINDSAWEINAGQRVFVLGVGKGVQAMASAVVDLLGELVASGLLITKHLDEDRKLPKNIQVITGSHPVPTERSVESARALVKFTRQFRKDDIIICLITGGGSSLMTLPVDGVELEDIQSVTRLLLSCGANISEINTIRKHIDQIKGGGLARLAHPGTLISLILSDVMGNPMEIIASGPTVSDPSTYSMAIEILKRYDIWEDTPKSIIRYLMDGRQGLHPETIKEGDSYLKRVKNYVVGDNLKACRAALHISQKLGFNSLLLTTYLKGEASEAGLFFAALLKEIDSTGYPVSRPCCIIVGGETTVNIHGSGKGGRNQEVALGAVKSLAGLPGVALVTLATDGEDGPTDAAGAIVTGETYCKGEKLGLNAQEYLQNNDSYHYFGALQDLLKMGPTGTNVNDINFLFAF